MAKVELGMMDNSSLDGDWVLMWSHTNYCKTLHKAIQMTHNLFSDEC